MFNPSNRPFPFRLAAIVASLSAALLTHPAGAAINSYTGDVVQVYSPPNADWLAFGQTHLGAYIFDEQQGVSVSGLPVDLVGNGTLATATPGFLSGTVDSHFVHVDVWTVPSTGAAVGTITFSGQILGLAYDLPALDASDVATGLPSTIYATGDFDRAIYLPYGTGLLGVNGSTLTFAITTGLGEWSDLRVLTQPLPAPGTTTAMLATLGIAAMRRRRIATTDRSETTLR